MNTQTDYPYFKLEHKMPDGQTETKIIKHAGAMMPAGRLDRMENSNFVMRKDAIGNYVMSNTTGHMVLKKNEVMNLVEIALEFLVTEERLQQKRFFPPFRVGVKQGRAVLDSRGYEVVIFPVGLEYLASDYVKRLNQDNLPI